MICILSFLNRVFFHEKWITFDEERVSVVEGWYNQWAWVKCQTENKWGERYTIYFQPPTLHYTSRCASLLSTTAAAEDNNEKRTHKERQRRRLSIIIFYKTMMMITIAIICYTISSVSGHGYLKTPRSRNLVACKFIISLLILSFC